MRLGSVVRSAWVALPYRIPSAVTVATTPNHTTDAFRLLLLLLLLLQVETCATITVTVSGYTLSPSSAGLPASLT